EHQTFGGSHNIDPAIKAISGQRYSVDSRIVAEQRKGKSSFAMRGAMAGTTGAALFGQRRNGLILKLHRVRMSVVGNRNWNLKRMSSIADSKDRTAIHHRFYPAAVQPDHMRIGDLKGGISGKIMRGLLEIAGDHQLAGGSPAVQTDIGGIYFQPVRLARQGNS